MAKTHEELIAAAAEALLVSIRIAAEDDEHNPAAIRELAQAFALVAGFDPDVKVSPQVVCYT